jgi:hypothetical protein
VVSPAHRLNTAGDAIIANDSAPGGHDTDAFLFGGKFGSLNTLKTNETAERSRIKPRITPKIAPALIHSNISAFSALSATSAVQE